MPTACSSADEAAPRAAPRGWGRLAGLALLILSVGAVMACASLLLAVAPGWRRRLREALLRQSSRLALALLRVEVHAVGLPPAPPFLLVANHLGYLDVAVLASWLPGRFVAKTEVRHWPLLGPVCRGLGTIFLDRQSPRDLCRVLAELEAALGRGEGVIVFPEGTSSAGGGVGPFRSSLLEVAARQGLPVHWAAIGYSSRQACWWGDMSFLPHLVRLFRSPPLEASLAFGREPLVDRDRKRLARRLREQIASRLGGAPPDLAGPGALEDQPGMSPRYLA